MNTRTQSESAVRLPPARRAFVRILRAAIGYCVLSCLTLPFIGHVWLGELPVLALIQLPKIATAHWLRTHVVMEALPFFGLSQGSFSPDYLMARPYALAIVYLVPMLIIGVAGLRRPDQRRRLTTVIFLVTATADYVFTLIFADGRFLTIY